MKKIDVFHNILWSKYKGVVFSNLYNMSDSRLGFNFFQIAATEKGRVGLNGVDLFYHKYPYELIFDKSYESISKIKLVSKLFCKVYFSTADGVIIPGYHQIEYWGMLLACVLKRKPRAVFCDSTGFDNKSVWYKAIFKRIFIRLCDCYLVYGDRSKCYLVSLGADPRYIFQRCQAAALPADYVKSEVYNKRMDAVKNIKQPTFVYVGRLSKEKGLDLLLRAFSKLIKEFDAKLIVIGAGDLKSELLRITKDLGIDYRVEFRGAMTLEQICDAYLNATSLVLPSSSEPWGLVVNEALSYGCPAVVSSACGCVPELVLERGTGEVFQVGDEESLLGSLRLMCKRNLSYYDEAAKTCLNVISNYSSERAAEQIKEGLNKLFSMRGGV